MAFLFVLQCFSSCHRIFLVAPLLVTVLHTIIPQQLCMTHAFCAALASTFGAMANAICCSAIATRCSSTVGQVLGNAVASCIMQPWCFHLLPLLALVTVMVFFALQVKTWRKFCLQPPWEGTVAVLV